MIALSGSIAAVDVAAKMAVTNSDAASYAYNDVKGSEAALLLLLLLLFPPSEPEDSWSSQGGTSSWFSDDAFQAAQAGANVRRSRRSSVRTSCVPMPMEVKRCCALRDADGDGPGRDSEASDNSDATREGVRRADAGLDGKRAWD